MHQRDSVFNPRAADKSEDTAPEGNTVSRKAQVLKNCLRGRCLALNTEH